MDITQIDEKTIEVIETKETVQKFDIDFLKQQREDILAQKERDNKQRDEEIAKIDLLLKEFNV